MVYLGTDDLFDRLCGDLVDVKVFLSSILYRNVYLWLLARLHQSL